MGSVALGDHSSPKPVYLISYGDPKPEQPATVIAVVSSKGKEQFVAAPENTVYYAPEIRSVIEKAEGRPPERVSCLYEKSCGAVVYRVEGRTVRFLVVKNKNGRHWGFPKGHMEYGESERQTARRCWRNRPKGRYRFREAVNTVLMEASKSRWCFSPRKAAARKW
ncbi:MAG: NUDIX domain-containing protein [[Clostridium] leptum]